MRLTWRVKRSARSESKYPIVRPAMAPNAARAHSAPTSHQKCGASGLPAKWACTASRIFFETVSIATGISAATRRQASMPQITGGPDRQTIPINEGMRRMARIRSCQLPHIVIVGDFTLASCGTVRHVCDAVPLAPGVPFRPRRKTCLLARAERPDESGRCWQECLRYELGP